MTGYLESAAKAMGRPQQVEHDRRYDQADEYLEVLYKLWEGSWEDDAVLNDPQRRIYAQPGKVHKVQHHGEFYHVDGYHLCEPSPQRTPVLFQAVKKQVAAIRDSAQRNGRDPQAIKVFMGISVVVAPTEAQAHEKFAEYLRYASPEAGLAHYAASTGIDFSRYAPDEPIRYEKNNAIESAVKNLTAKEDWTVARILKENALGGRYPALVGSPVQVADALQAWVEDTGLDGFNLTRTVTPESYEDFINLVIPELQSRGLYKTEYADGSLRNKLFADGDRLPAEHSGAGWRVGASPVKAAS